MTEEYKKAPIGKNRHKITLEFWTKSQLDEETLEVAFFKLANEVQKQIHINDFRVKVEELK